MAGLRLMRPPVIIVGNSQKYTVPRRIKDVWAATAAGLATWLDPASGIRDDYKGLQCGKTDLRIYLATTPYPQSCVE